MCSIYTGFTLPAFSSWKCTSVARRHGTRQPTCVQTSRVWPSGIGRAVTNDSLPPMVRTNCWMGSKPMVHG